MEVIKYPSREEWASLALRPALDVTTLFDTVRTVLNEVRKGGDAAVIRYEEKFDKIDPATFKRLQVSEQELAEAKELVPEELKQAIRQAKNNIEIFHASQRFTGKKVETTPGVTCWQKAVAIEKVGTGCHLLAESGSDRKSRFIHSRRNGSSFLYRPDVGCPGTYCRL